MRLVSFRTNSGISIGWKGDFGIFDLVRAHALYAMTVDADLWMPFVDMTDVIDAETTSPGLLSAIREFIVLHDLHNELLIENADLIAPLQPTRIIALGLNYAEHARETGKEPPKEPIFFTKPTTAVIGPNEPVICPPDVGRIDHEVELAVVIGQEGRNIQPEDALEYVFGYTILNDVTARDMQAADMAEARPWFICKGIDTFAPLGPWIVTAEEFAYPLELDLTLRVNGEKRQQGNTRDLIFTIPDIIARLSRYITLESGDVIATGTPPGISPISPGDIMEAEIEEIGVLRNPVVSEI